MRRPLAPPATGLWPRASMTGGLECGALLRGLNGRRVRYVVTGSVAALAHGLDLDPGDLDIAPSLDQPNLRRLAGYLELLGAKPKHVPEWKAGPTREECESWTPHPPSPERLDHRFVTPHGELDVVPVKSGPYAELIDRATPVTLWRVKVRVAHPADLIEQWRRWNRPRDRDRLATLQRVLGLEGRD